MIVTNVRGNEIQERQEVQKEVEAWRARGKRGEE